MNNSGKKFIRLKKAIASVALFLLVFQLFAPAMAYPRAASAVLGVGDITTVASNIWDTIWKVTLKSLNVVVSIGYKNMLSTFLNKVAYDSAVYIGSGGKGQKPMFLTKEIGTYLRDAADAAYGNFLDNLSKEVWGRSLCDTDPIIKVKFSVWAMKIKEPPEPKALQGKCTITKIGESIEKTAKGQLADFSKTFNSQANDFGAFLSITTGAQKAAEEKERVRTLERLIYGEFDPKKSTITDETRTPSEVVKETYNESYKQAFKRYTTFTGDAAADALGIFTNTLVSQMMKTVFEKGLNPELDADVGAQFVSGTSGGIAAAKILFSSLSQPDYVTGGELNIIDSLTSCADIDNPLPNTCVIDNRFRTAIEEQITVQQAIDKGLLDAKKIFGYNLNGSEPNYLNGYPYRSLVILRKNRVIPVGWELAAKYIKQYSPGNYSLGSLIDDYENEDSPFYHLVDPNWVLKAPAAFCKRQGASEKIIYNEVIRTEDTTGNEIIDIDDVGTSIIQRQDYCADEQTCILEGEDGSCKKFGYCIEEESVWRFDATSCESQYMSCQAFSDREGNSVSYLSNTVDYNNCSASNVGCQWYCRDWDTGSSQWTCSNQAPPAGGNKLSFNKDVEVCGASDDGCNEFMPVKGGNNMIVNSGLETYERNYNSALLTDGYVNTTWPDNFLGWNSGGTNDPAGASVCFGGDDHGNACIANNECDSDECTSRLPCGDRLYATTESFNGETAGRISSLANCSAGDPAHYTYQRIDTGSLTDNRQFNLSFFARLDPDDFGDCSVAPGELSFQLSRTIDDAVPITEYTPSTTTNALNNEWTRYTRTFRFGEPADPWNGVNVDQLQRTLSLIFRRGGSVDCDVLIDNVKFEEGELTQFNDYVDNQKTYLQKPPDYLGCSYNLATNDPACDDFALYCSSNEVGCQEYTSQSGDVVNGIITDPFICDFNNPSSCNQCPAEYVGCKAFKELAIEHAPQRAERDPVSFVPGTGNSCPASSVGCEEYTNLNKVAQGGEGLEYYSQIRQCVEEDDPDTATYYTWEGSDEFGYQLKSYKLKESNIGLIPEGAPPCTNINPEWTNPNSWPVCNDSTAVGNPNYWADCSDTCNAATNTCDNKPNISCDTDQDCIRADYDCREFFDSDGDIFYRLKSRVVYATDECTPYRNSIDGNTMTYHMVSGQGIECNPDHTGCRAYKGNAGDNTHIIYSEEFESGTVSPWVGDVFYSNESVHQGGHSMLVSGSPQSIATATEAGNDLGMQSDKSYIISFSAKGAANNSAVVVGFTGLVFPGTANILADDWNQYSLGPLYIPADYAIELRSLSIVGSSAYFIDNIVIKEITDDIYYIKDSYTECSGWENCDLYTDTGQNINYLKSFSRLCDEEKVGCKSLFNTQNSSTPFNMSYTMTQTTNGILPADTTVNMVVESDKMCAASEKGCARFGLPTIDADGIVASYDDSFLKNDPDQYLQILCALEDSGCEEYTTGDNQKYYFKKPGEENVCNYMKSTGTDTYGWYKAGTTSSVPDCPVSTGWCSATSPNAYDRCNIDPDGTTDDCGAGGVCDDDEDVVRQPIDGWVGICSETKSGCTQIVDPETPVDPVDQICDITVPGSCQASYSLAQELDQASCNGIVDRAEGCRLFYDTSNETINYNTDNTDDEETPALCNTPGIMGVASADCNANSIYQVVKDRVCGTWLECASTWRTTSNTDKGTGGKVEDLCMQRMACDQMDENTGQCINPIDLSAVNETYNTPVFVDSIKNKSGMVLAGLDWDRRCENTGLACTGDNNNSTNDPDCTEVNGNQGNCLTDPQIIEGYFPFSAMEQVGLSGSSERDLIPDGDFFDANYRQNYQLSRYLSCNYLGSCVAPPNAPEPSGWQSMGTANIDVIEDGANSYGDSFNLDENNILQVVPTVSPSNWWGAQVRFADGIGEDQEFVLSYKVRRKIIPEITHDYVQVFIGWEPIGAPISPAGHTAYTIKRGAGTNVDWEEVVVKINMSDVIEDFATIQGLDRDDVATEIESANNIHIRFQTRCLENCPGGLASDVPFYLDDVSLKPALEVQSPPDPSTLVTRSCRMYPKTNSPLCSYTDENLLTNHGWYGYCLEHDPIFKDYCISWWPIDLIAGESNIFSQGLSDVRYTGRRPLYMCVEASGNYGPTAGGWPVSMGRCEGFDDEPCGVFNDNCADCTQIGCSSQMTCGGTFNCADLNNDEQTCELAILAGASCTWAAPNCTGGSGIACTVFNNDCGTCDAVAVVSSCTSPGNFTCSGVYDCADIQNEELCNASQCFGWSGSTTDYPYLPLIKNETNQICAAQESVCDEDTNLGTCGEDYSWGRGWQCQWYRHDSGLETIPIDAALNGQVHRDDLESVTFEVIRHEHADWPAVGSKWVATEDPFLATGEPWSVAWCGSEYTCNSSSNPIHPSSPTSCVGDNWGHNFWGARITFNANGYVEGFETRTCDGTTKGGGMLFNVWAQLKEPCERIVQVVNESDEPIVWAGRMQNDSAYSVPDLLYSYDEDYQPYGGIVNPDQDPVNCPLGDQADPATWCEPLFSEQWNIPPLAPGDTDAMARSRWAYACGENCLGRVCNWDNGNLCENGPDIDTCIEHDVGGGPLDDGFCIGVGQVDDNGDGIYNNSGGGTWASNQSVDNAKERIKRLFAQPAAGLNSSWVWDFVTSRYIVDNSFNWYSEFDQIPLCSSPSDRNSFATDYCAIQPEGNFTLGVGDEQVTGGTVNLGAGGIIQLILSMRANAEQAPIVRYIIDWGDSSPPSENIGRFPDGAQIFTHYYNTEPDVNFPAIQIEDNWGYCSNPVLAGPLPQRRQSCNSDLDYWIHFNGQINVD